VLFLLNLIVASAAVYLVWRLIVTIQIRMGRSLADDFYRDKLYFAGFVLLALGDHVGSLQSVPAKGKHGELLCWSTSLLAGPAFC
jgi:hypothetical protein